MNVLVLSATASAINYVNALGGRSDLRLFVTDASKYASGLYGEHVVPLLVPRARDLEQYRASLDRIIASHAVDLLIPTSDHDMEGVMELVHQGWDPPVRLFRPDYHVYRTLTHKTRLNEALHRAGLPAPRTYQHGDEIEFPAVVKPAREGGSKGVWIVHSPRELAERIASVQQHYPGDTLIQQFIPGDTGSIYVALQLYGPDGRLFGEAASHSHLTYMSWGGGGVAGSVVDEPDLLALARRVIAELGGWRGPVNLEFKRHARTGQFYLLEVNCRLNGYSYLFTMNGLNFPAAVVDLLVSGATPFLQLPAGGPRHNFVIGFREQPREDWVRVAS
jgi:predicted ATP-grasp superfamily ATP-dependent carboligase